MSRLKDTAHRPSAANQEYVIRSDGKKVKNTAYNPKTTPQHEEIPDVTDDFQGFVILSDEEAEKYVNNLDEQFPYKVEGRLFDGFYIENDDLIEDIKNLEQEEYRVGNLIPDEDTRAAMQYIINKAAEFAEENPVDGYIDSEIEEEIFATDRYTDDGEYILDPPKKHLSGEKLDIAYAGDQVIQGCRKISEELSGAGQIEFLLAITRYQERFFDRIGSKD